MDSTMMLMDVISAACAAYCAYTWVRLLRERKLFKNELLLGKDKKPEDCLDEDGYVSYVLPRLGVLTASPGDLRGVQCSTVTCRGYDAFAVSAELHPAGGGVHGADLVPRLDGQGQ